MKLIIVVTILVQFLILANSRGIRGRSCKLHTTGGIGKCKPLSQCQGARLVQSYHNIPPTYCSGGAYPFVCCEHSGYSKKHKNTKIQTQNISAQKCQEYYTRRRVKRTEIKPAIVGGTLSNRGEFPYMTAIGWHSPSGYDYKCGGFLVSPDHVVTAAHCANLGGTSPVIVRPGGNSLDHNDESPIISIAKIVVHPAYSNKHSYNDIAVIKLSGYTAQTPACLWQSSGINYEDAVAIGYGHTQFAGKGSNELRKVSLKIYSNAVCSRYYQPGHQLEKGILSSQICAGELSEPKDTCQGDSGGPLLVKANSNGRTISYVIGITSFGDACGGGVPSVYTRISPYVSWIESVVWFNR